MHSLLGFPSARLPGSVAMDLKRYLELYLSESQDHLRALGAGLLALTTSGAIARARSEPSANTRSI